MSILDSIVIKYHDNGKVHVLTEVTPFGTPEGCYVRWHENGHIAEECNIARSVIHGKHRSWYQNGQIKSAAEYMLGEKHGLYSTYDTYGRITKKVFYINGKPHGLVTLRTGSDEILYQYYNQGKYITEQVQQRVTDITKITDYEKTILALELGLLL